MNEDSGSPLEVSADMGDADHAGFIARVKA